MALYLGIDLGTSNSVVAGLRDNKVRVYRPTDGGDTLPTLIYVDKRGHRLFGRRAAAMLFQSPENVAAGFKRLLGTRTPIVLSEAGVTLTPEECSAEMIRQLLGQVENEIGPVEIDGAVITVPAAFNQMQREATLVAAQQAGLTRVELLAEPIAAAMAAVATSPRDGKFLIYDLGGGTFDLALAEAKEGEVKIIANQGINMLGGRDFDRLIVHEIVKLWLLENFALPEDFARDKKWKRLMRVAQAAAERAKIDLSQVEETQIFASEDEVRLQDNEELNIYIDATLDRKAFEKLIKKPVENTIHVMQQLLAEAELQPGDLDSIVFVGGPSRIPLIREMVGEALGVKVDLKLDPLTAVAVGAAHYAESLDFSGAKKAAPKADAVQEKPVAVAPAAKSAGTPAKAKTATAELDKKATGLDLAFDYAARTSAEKANVKLKLNAAPAKARWLRAFRADGQWESPLYKLEDGLTLTLPLLAVGENAFAVRVFDEQRDPLPKGERQFSIVRTAAAAAQIPATQTVAVKLIDRRIGENMLEPLVQKGTPLPASGQAVFRAARDLKGDSTGTLALELFQLEYPEKVELNLCIGTFAISGADLPAGYVIRKGEPVTFNWEMDASGILRASVLLPAHEEDGGGAVELATPRFYSPQAGAIAYDIEHGLPFAHAMLKQTEEDWGDLAAAIGPAAGKDVGLLQDRIQDQQEVLRDNPDDAEVIRQVSEEARFLRQDIARVGRSYPFELLQRRALRLSALFNRVARAFANAEELDAFDGGLREVQDILDAREEEQALVAERRLEELTDDFFDLAWRDRGFVNMWFRRLKEEAFLFPDAAEYQSMLEAGQAHARENDDEALRALVKRMFEIRVRLAASDTVAEPASLMKGD